MLSNALNERPYFSHIIFFFLPVKFRAEFKILLLSYTILNNQAFLLWNQKMIWNLLCGITNELKPKI